MVLLLNLGARAPRLAYIEVGIPVLARRLHPKLEKWAIAIQSRWGAKQQGSWRIPWNLLDLSDPESPRLYCTRSELEALKEQLERSNSSQSET